MTFKTLATVGNNGNQLFQVLNGLGLIEDGQTMDQIESLAGPYMLRADFLKRDDFWEDFCYSAEEAGYTLKY